MGKVSRYLEENHPELVEMWRLYVQGWRDFLFFIAWTVRIIRATVITMIAALSYFVVLAFCVLRDVIRKVTRRSGR